MAKLALGSARHDDTQPLGLRYRKRAEQERIDDAEDRDIGANAKAEARDRHTDEAGPMGEPSKRRAHVLDQRHHRDHGAFAIPPQTNDPFRARVRSCQK